MQSNIDPKDSGRRITAMKKLAVLNLILVLSLVLGSAAFAQDIYGDANAYFSGGTKNIGADALFDNLNDGDDSNNPYIIDVRSEEDHNKGYIPTSVWMDAKTLFTEANLATLPTDQQIVVYCYTGQTASQVTSALNSLGYDAYNLRFGFGSWTMDADAGSRWFDETVHGNDFPTTTDPTAVTLQIYPLPTPLGDTTQAAVDAYFSGGTKNISAADLYDNLSDGDSSNDPWIISVRSQEDYETRGHIPGAVWMDYKTMFTTDALGNVPDNRPIVVYCYTGQTASQVTSMLNAMGYDASNMLFGMQAWTMDQDVRKSSFTADASFGFPYEGAAAAPEEPTAEPTAQPEPTAEPEPVEPATMPETGGVPIPVEGLLVGFGTLTAAAGIYLRRRKAA
jgi:rhodanese-related sulfurtransferase